MFDFILSTNSAFESNDAVFQCLAEFLVNTMTITGYLNFKKKDRMGWYEGNVQLSIPTYIFSADVFENRYKFGQKLF